MPVDSQARDRYLDDVAGASDHWFQERRTAIRTTARISVAVLYSKFGEQSGGAELDETGVRARGDEV
jgi:hypothetical protein